MPTPLPVAPSTLSHLLPGGLDFGDTLPHVDALVGPLAKNGLAAPRDPITTPLHLLDASMFWSPQGAGGVRRYLSHKRELLREVGWLHTLMAPGIGPGADGEQTIDCGGVPIPGSHGYRFVVRRGPAARLMEQARPHLIEAADPYVLGWAALDAAQRLDIPAIAFCHSHLPALVERMVPASQRQGACAQWLRRRAERYLTRLYAGYDLVLAPSAAMVEALRGLGVSNAQHQPLGVDCSVFNPSARDAAWAQALRARLGLPDHTKLLLYVGRFAPEKNLHVLAEAVDRLGPGHALLAVGAGPTPPAGDRVRLLPVEPDSHRLARLVASADAFVHAGDQETFGLSVLEAMACGTPMVVSAAGGVGELAGGVGFTVASQRPSEWAEAIHAAVNGGHRSRTERGLERARLHHWPLVLGALMRRYLRVLDMPVRTQARSGRAQALSTGPATTGWG